MFTDLNSNNYYWVHGMLKLSKKIKCVYLQFIKILTSDLHL